MAEPVPSGDRAAPSSPADPSKLAEQGPPAPARRLAVMPLVLLIKVYQVLISPLIGPRCRFLPTCSDYALEALRRHGLVRGGWLAARRIGRCHPWGDSGYDPVPPVAGGGAAAKDGSATSCGCHAPAPEAHPSPDEPKPDTHQR